MEQNTKQKMEPNEKQKYEYRVIDYQRPYKDYSSKEKTINSFAIQGWELVCTSVIPMGVSEDRRDGKFLGWKIWCIEHLYFKREMRGE